MKNIKSIIAFTIGLLFLVMQEAQAQDKTDYRKISETSIPAKVKEAASKIAGFKIKEVAIDTKKSSEKKQVYLVTLYKGKRTQQYLINAEGKILEMLE